MSLPERKGYDWLTDCVREFAREHLKRAARRIVIHLDDGEEVILPITTAAMSSPATSCSHSPDYRKITWQGKDYDFTRTQARVIALLWEAWEAGAPKVHAAKLLEAANSEAKRVRDVFRVGGSHCKAWLDDVIDSDGEGNYFLSER